MFYKMSKHGVVQNTTSSRVLPDADNSRDTSEQRDARAIVTKFESTIAHQTIN